VAHARTTTVETLRVGSHDIQVVRPLSADAVLDEAVAASHADAPYWAELWPSAGLLAAVVAGLPGLDGARVAELGCGLGLPALAAACAGADVVACDAFEEALALVRESARLTGTRLRTLAVDLIAAPEALLAEPRFDVVVAADVLYEPPLAGAMASLVPRLLAPQGRALIAYPFRNVEAAHALGARLARDGLVVRYEQRDRLLHASS
jgi:predicted nicotinamide N-methyase